MSKLQVLYNGDCPICSREIAHYQSLRPVDVDFIPITKDTAHEWGLSEDEAAAQLHARLGDDTICLSGVAAFGALWRAIPRYRWLGRLMSVAPIGWLADRVYRHLLAPALFALHKRRQRKRT